MEPKIQIGDHVLTEAQAMALRVAATVFQTECAGKKDAIYSAYNDRLTEVLTIMLKEKH